MSFTMLEQLLSLTEQKIETKTAEDLWAEKGGDAIEYHSAAQYMVRRVKGSSPDKFEAYKLVDDKKTKFGEFSAQELKKVLTPIRANQKPDVEGYTTYVEREKVQAVKYAGDTLDIDLDGDGNIVRLADGDYLVRTVDGTDYVFNIEKETDFESAFTKA